MKPHALLFEPLLKERVWGGTLLSRFGKSVPASKTIGESWELADLPDSIPDGRSRISNGPLAGLTLREAIAAHGEMIMGKAKLTGEGGFPLLIKLLDARENLSVQVHPTARYAAEHPGSHLKSEAWYIMHAEPGSVIYNGFNGGVTRESFAEHLRSGDIRKDLRAVPAVAGDCHYLPSGTCHA
ncbi:MAG TPA: type I phosphomannose isomerase catalytic subunit, partial [Phycisphaerales bacterium]|nr:type I phosphomannose isomerase catalytic subunit [Phycisphaerales bacterium]